MGTNVIRGGKHLVVKQSRARLVQSPEVDLLRMKRTVLRTLVQVCGPVGRNSKTVPEARQVRFTSGIPDYWTDLAFEGYPVQKNKEGSAWPRGSFESVYRLR